MLARTVGPHLVDGDLAKSDLHDRFGIVERLLGAFRFLVVNGRDHAVVQMRSGIGEVSLLSCGFIAGIGFSRVRVLLLACVIRICGVAWFYLEGNVDGFVFVDDHAVPIVECHGNRAIAVVVDVVDGRISAYGCAIVGYRHILRDIGAVCHIGEIDRINPLRQGVGDGIRSDFRGCGDGVVDLFECLRQIFRGRSVVFLAGDGVRFFG